MQKLYSSLEASKEFTERQNNEAHHQISKIITDLILQNQNGFTSILNLGGRGNPQFFGEIGESFEKFTWLTPSYHLEQIAKANKPSNLNLSFKTGNTLDYLAEQDDNSIELAFMKHTFAEIENLEKFFKLMHSKLQTGGKFIANISNRSKLNPFSRNAGYFISGHQVKKEGEELNDGDKYTVKFLSQYDAPENGYITDGELDFYYHDYISIEEAAIKSQLKVIHLGDYKEITAEKHQVDSDILILTKTQ